MIDVDLVCRGNTLASTARSHGGEWDAHRRITRRNRRRLIGARMMTPHGLAPDQLAEIVGDWYGREFTCDEVVHWYVRHCLLQLSERRRLRNARTYRRRDQLARDRGYRSFWDQRHTRERHRLEAAA